MLTLSLLLSWSLYSGFPYGGRAVQNLFAAHSNTDLRDEQAVPSDLQGTSKQPNPQAGHLQLLPFSTAEDNSIQLKESLAQVCTGRALPALKQILRLQK